MPHDRNGQEIKVGDVVSVLAEVTNVSPGEEFCNCTVKQLGDYAPQAMTFSLTLNTKQVLKEEALVPARDSAPEG